MPKIIVATNLYRIRHTLPVICISPEQTAPLFGASTALYVWHSTFKEDVSFRRASPKAKEGQ